MYKFLGRQFSGETTPNFVQQIVIAIYYPLFGKVWWVPFADLCLRSPWWAAN